MSGRILPRGLTPVTEKAASGAPEVIRPGGVLGRPTLVCLLILTLLAILGALYVGKDVILPLVLAILLKLLLQPIDYMQQAFKENEDVTAPGGNEPNAPTVRVREQSAIAASLARGTLASLGRFFATMVILFFLLAAGDRLLRGFIEILPRLSDKQQAIDIAFEIQRSIGGYLLTITVMNSLVGIATGLAMW